MLRSSSSLLPQVTLAGEKSGRDILYKRHKSTNKYNYRVLLKDADKYETFFIDADFDKDIHIGFSATDGHNNEIWEILVGGWNGQSSVIRFKNQRGFKRHVKVDHTLAEFNNFKHTLQVCCQHNLGITHLILYLGHCQ